VINHSCYSATMPRIPRGQVAGFAYHVINRGNGRSEIFHKPGDYEAFVDLIERAKARHELRVFAFCIMPNHFHMILQPSTTTVLSEFMQWLMTSHVRRYHSHYGGSGHIWQGRFKSFPIQRDEHLVAVLRYVLQNPVRAGLTKSAREWKWSSVKRNTLVDPCPIAGWDNSIKKPLKLEELKALRECVNRQRPFGTSRWQQEIAMKLGLESTIRPRGRPRGSTKK